MPSTHHTKHLMLKQMDKRACYKEGQEEAYERAHNYLLEKWQLLSLDDKEEVQALRKKKRRRPATIERTEDSDTTGSTSEVSAVGDKVSRKKPQKMKKNQWFISVLIGSRCINGLKSNVARSEAYTELDLHADTYVLGPSF